MERLGSRIRGSRLFAALRASCGAARRRIRCARHTALGNTGDAVWKYAEWERTFGEYTFEIDLLNGNVSWLVPPRLERVTLRAGPPHTLCI
jgi:hypothetical protein